jgi:FdhD protein
MSGMVKAFDVVRVRGEHRGADVDRAATEEPLEIRLHSRPFAVIMRTPGADRELAAGFLLAEQVIASADDLGTIEYCTSRDAERIALRSTEPAEAGGQLVARPFQGREENTVNVTLIDPARVERALADRRQVTTNSSCGMCGRRTIESLTANVARISSTWTMPAAVLLRLPERLRAAQSGFDETGGLHAAGLFTPDAGLVDHAEDVGRHNAVDKVIGRMLMREALPLSQHLLCVSGRTSFEIVQKAVLAGIPIVAAVSAPSSLAIDLAEESGITLVGFVRGDSFNIYTHAARIT